MTVNKNINKETLKILSQENRRLKQENQRLRESLNELQEYKDEYRRLIGEVRLVKERYSENMDKLDGLKKSYENELSQLKEANDWR